MNTLRTLIEHEAAVCRGAARARPARGLPAWMLVALLVMGQALKKVTVLLPEELVLRAQRAHGEGIAPTIRRGLELVAARRAYQEMRRQRGKVKLSIDTKTLREDR